jgi:ComEC/Rec2-related protein
MILACVGTGALRHRDFVATDVTGNLQGSERAVGEVISVPVARANGDRMVVDVERVEGDAGWADVDARVLVYLPPDLTVTIGDRLEMAWSFTPVDSMAPGIRGFTLSQDSAGSATVWSVHVIEPSGSIRRHLVDLRRRVSDRIQSLVPGDSGALMSGIVTGDDSALSSAARQAFAQTGTGHITAVSGSNIAMLLALWSRTVRTRTSRHNLTVQTGIVLSIWAYCISTGLEASALRASTVATLIVFSGRFGRRADPLTVLSLASAGLLMMEPSLVGSVGFWLSVSASGALAGAFSGVELDTWKAQALAAIRGLIAAQFATLPIVVWTFGTWYPVGVVANVLIAPLMAIAFPASFLFAAVAFVPWLGKPLAVVPALTCDLTLAIVERLTPLLPSVRLASAGSAELVLIAVPCAAIVLYVNRDARRWAPRWAERASSNPGVVASAAGGILAGLTVAAAIAQRFG